MFSSDGSTTYRLYRPWLGSFRNVPTALRSSPQPAEPVTLTSVVGLVRRVRVSYAERTYHGLNTFFWRVDEPGGEVLK